MVELVIYLTLISTIINTWLWFMGGNSVSENVGPKHLINIKSVAERRENMLWFRVP